MAHGHMSLRSRAVSPPLADRAQWQGASRRDDAAWRVGREQVSTSSGRRSHLGATGTERASAPAGRQRSSTFAHASASKPTSPPVAVTTNGRFTRLPLPRSSFSASAVDMPFSFSPSFSSR